eukprot:1180048-Prorocentrum_minimum.AAC.1
MVNLALGVDNTRWGLGGLGVQVVMVSVDLEGHGGHEDVCLLSELVTQLHGMIIWERVAEVC